MFAGTLDSDIMVDFLKHRSPLNVQTEGRITFFPTAPPLCGQTAPSRAPSSRDGATVVKSLIVVSLCYFVRSALVGVRRWVSFPSDATPSFWIVITPNRFKRTTMVARNLLWSLNLGRFFSRNLNAIRISDMLDTHRFLVLRKVRESLRSE